MKVDIKFKNNELCLNFHEEDIEAKSLKISVIDDVNFKELVDYLITLIPNQDNISASNEELPDVENAEKLRVIQETVNQIIEEFNSSVASLNEED